ncbi:MAG: ATP-dependent DNA helicase RecG [Candidatus Dormibacteria bacterium]
MLTPGHAVSAVPGVTAAYVKKLERIGVRTVGDLLRYYPRKYDDYTAEASAGRLIEGQRQTVRATVQSTLVRRPFRTGARPATEAILRDSTGTMKAIWFNQPWMADRLVEGQEVTLSGLVRRSRGGGGLVMMNPSMAQGDGASSLHTGRRVPMYRETFGLTSRWLREAVSAAMPAVLGLRDTLPPEVEARHGLPSLARAIRDIHFPPDEAAETAAQRRIAFNQLLVMQMSVLLLRDERSHQRAPLIPYDVERARAIRDAMPFTLTNAQRKCAHAVFTDLAASRPMARLLQGDVGSGKTAIAAMATAMAAASGHQTLFMAPTELLAQQHARTLRPLLERIGVRMEVLVGSTPASARRTVMAGLADGFLDIVVGTHALIEEPVQPRRLGLVITDEQHRFGVAQRETLARKGGDLYPHVLSMTATPIPRTLQLTMYGDLAVSVLDEMPSGRTPVITELVLPIQREHAERFLRAQVEAGRQAFVICPLVEDSDLIQVRSATSEYERLQADVFPDLRLALLHGRMKPRDKDEVMEAFKAGAYDVLVSTAVVEVGVDVPNATVMMIEGAERFGLAQLHQFRGRVGRGAHQSHCLLCSDAENPEAIRRLDAMVRLQSGFDLAEEDLRLRGPGDVLGASGVQSGHDAALMVAGLTDTRLISLAREEAERLLAEGTHRYPALVEAARGFHLTGSLS